MIKFDYKNIEYIARAAMELMETKHINNEVGNIIMDAIYHEWHTSKEDIEDIMNRCNCEERIAVVLAILHDYLGLEFNEYQLDKLDKSLSQLDVEEFKNNRYLKDIDLSSVNVKKNDINFEVASFKPYEIYQVSTSIRNKNFDAIYPTGYFREKVDFPLLSQGGDAWMTITPSEINTMKHHINAMKGNVVVFGLGLGYFAYLTALKDNVDSITIIEINQDIIDIFNEHILPQFNDKAKEKIHIIKGDAYEYFLDKEFMNKFNSCFIDIWKNRLDGIPMYCFFKENEKKLKCKLRYWLEEEFITGYQDTLCNYILNKLQTFLDKENAPDLYSLSLTPDIQILLSKIDKYFNSNRYLIKDKGSLFDLIFDKNIMKKIIQLPLT